MKKMLLSTLAIAASICSFAQVISTPYSEDFESGPNGWIIYNDSATAVNGTWELADPAGNVIIGASSGDSAFVTNSTGDYNNGDNSWVTSPLLDISGTLWPTVQLDVWWESEFSWDGAVLQSSLDTGATWTNVGTMLDTTNWYTDNTIDGNPGGQQEGWTGRNGTGATGGANGWVKAVHTLENNTTDTLMFRVAFGSDGSVSDEGFAFDNFKVESASHLGDDRVVCNLTDSVLLSVNMNKYPGATHLWSNGSTNDSIYAYAEGDYWIETTLGVDVYRDSVFVRYIDTLTAYELGADFSVCGTEATLEVSDTTASSYLWSNAETTNSTTVTIAGQYYVDVTGACGFYTDTVTIGAFNPNPVVALGADTSACEGLIIELDATTADVTYLWNTSVNDTLAMLSADTSGTYAVIITDTLTTCIGTDSIMVTFNTPTMVNLGLDTTVCDSISFVLDAGTADSYVWSDASTNQTLTVPSTGTYSVTITDANGCTSNDEVDVTYIDCTAGIQELDAIQFSLYPNPSNGIVTLNINGSMNEAVNVSVIDFKGQAVQNHKFNNGNNVLDLSDLATGTYFVKLTSNNASSVQKIVIRK